MCVGGGRPSFLVLLLFTFTERLLCARHCSKYFGNTAVHGVHKVHVHILMKQADNKTSILIR